MPRFIAAFAFVISLCAFCTPGFAQDFWGSLRNGKVDRVSKAISENADLLESKQNGNTPLIEAARYRQTGVVKKLIELGANLKTKSSDGYTAIHFAIMNRDANMLDALLAQEDAPLNDGGRNRFTPLMMSINYGFPDGAKKLIAKGVDVTKKNQNGQSALMMAAQYGQGEIAELLIDKGLDFYEKDQYKNSPFLMACQAGKFDLVKKHFDKDKANNTLNSQKQSCVIMSTMSGNKELVAFLCENTKFATTADANGFTPIQFAAQYGQLEVVKVLLENGSDVNTPGKQYMESPIISAVNQNNMPMLELLIKKGADTNQKSSQSGQYPLHLACAMTSQPWQRGNAEYEKQVAKMIEYLLENKADPNLLNDQKKSALQIAFSASFPAAVELLIDKTDKVEFDQEAQSMFQWACENGMTKTVGILLTRNRDWVNKNFADGQSPICVAATSGYVDIVKLLIKSGADVNEAAEDGQLPLHCAASNNSKCFDVLLEAGSDPAAQDSSGRSPLHVAAWFGDVSKVKLLAGRSVNMSAKSQSGATAMHIAAWRNHPEVLQALIDYRLDVDEQDQDGWTPLHKAAVKGNVEAVRTLLSLGADKNATDGIGLKAIDKTGGEKANQVRDLLR